jgi:hypothetical protein
MKNRPIDKMLCLLERRADLMGMDIDSDSDYVFICEALASFDVEGGEMSYDFKEQIFFRLRKLFQEVNMDFHMMLMEILMGE